MFVQHPHDFACVHCTAAAQRDYYVGGKGAHLFRTCLGACKRGVGRNVEEAGMCNAHFVEFVLNRLGVAVVVQETVRNDKRLLFVHHRLKFVKSNGQTTFFDVNLLRCTEPQHIFSPFGYGFDIEQMLHSDVFTDGVTAPTAATEGKRRNKFEVVNIADTALRRWSVDKHAAGLHTFVKFLQFGLLRYRVEINA